MTIKRRKQTHAYPAGARPPSAPCVPALARGLEKRIVTILKRLVKESNGSCVDGSFRSGYEKALFLFSKYQESVLSHYPLKMTCGPRCGVCCYHWPEDTYSFEVQYVADFLKRNRPGDVQAICKALGEDISCLRRIKREVSERLKDPSEKAAIGDIDPYDLALSSFYRLRRPCPLLTRDGSCSIYSIRPLTCRVYISFSSREYCKPSRISSDKALTYLLDLEQDATDLFDQLHFMYDTFDGDTSFRSMLYRALKG